MSAHAKVLTDYRKSPVISPRDRSAETARVGASRYITTLMRISLLDRDELVQRVDGPENVPGVARWEDQPIRRANVVEHD